MTYCEYKRQPVVDWFNILSDVTQFRKVLTRAQQVELINKAGGWDQSPAGHLPTSLPRNELGAPIDRQLRLLDIEFSYQCSELLWADALKTYHLINAKYKTLTQSKSK
jgi:hypothetical protein